MMNDELQKDNRELRKNQMEIEKDRDDSVEEVDRLETGKRYTNGLLKNIGELNKMYVITNNNIQLDVNKMNNYYINQNTCNSRYKYICVISLLGNIITLYKLDINLAMLILSLITLMYYGVYMNSTSSKKVDKMYVEVYANYITHTTNTKLEIDRITKSQDFLGDLIDNI